MSNIAAVRAVRPEEVPQELLDKYSRPGPRYTSYPTAPQFKSEFNREEVEERWRASNATGKGLSLYAHLPFCRKRCHFCGCHVEVGNSRHRATEYVEHLLSEVDSLPRMLDLDRPLRQMAFGGGTPTFLTPEVMTHLVSSLKERLSFDPDIEQSIEIDPMTVDDHYIDVLSGLGFNRFSFGIQDLNDEVQKGIGRVQDEALIYRNIRHLQALGHTAINLDLIYGLPHQTPQTFEETINKVIDLHPSRIAMYGYAHVPWVSPHQQKLERFHLPTPDERVVLFGLGADMLLDAGYAQVGMDHFALPDDELIAALHEHTLNRNFMGYSTKRGLDLVGVGASSISFVGATYTQNVKETVAYQERAATDPWHKALLLTKEDELRGEVILELMCNLWLDIRSIEAKHGVEFAEHFATELDELQPMQADGLVEIDSEHISVTPLGMYFIRNISMPFDEYLRKQQAQPATYSRTI